MKTKKYIMIKTKQNIIKKVINSLFGIVICLAPLMTIYTTYRLDTILLAVIMVFIFTQIINTGQMRLNGFIVVFCVMLISKILSDFFLLNGFNINFNRSVGALMTLIIFSLLTKTQCKEVLKIYRIFAWTTVVFFILQIICYYFLKYPLVFNLPFLSVDSNLEFSQAYLNRCLSYGVKFPRFPGMFSEPANYAAYIIPLLIIELYDNSKATAIYKSLLIFLTIVLSTSGVGIVIGIVIYIIYIFKLIKNNKLKIPVWVVVLFALGTSIFAVLYFHNQSFRESLMNLFSSGIQGRSSKADYRIYRGIDFYFRLPSFFQVFGIGLYNAEAFSIIYNIKNAFDVDNALYEYFNGLSQLFIYGGIPGFFSFIYAIKTLNIANSIQKRMLLIAYILLIIGTAHLFDQTALIYISLIESLSKTEEQ